jgi:hypothetical protein
LARVIVCLIDSSGCVRFLTTSQSFERDFEIGLSNTVITDSFRESRGRWALSSHPRHGQLFGENPGFSKKEPLLVLF